MSMPKNNLFYYTSGYPFLVSKLCKMLDKTILPTKTTKAWTDDDLETAVQELVKESNRRYVSAHAPRGEYGAVGK